jgi:hypothetical protein
MVGEPVEPRPHPMRFGIRAFASSPSVTCKFTFALIYFVLSLKEITLYFFLQ